MTEDTIKYPITSPTTTINFRITSKVSYSRKATKLFEEGDLDGYGISESAGTSLLKIKFTFNLFTDDTNAAIEMWDELDELMRIENEESMLLTLNFNSDLGAKIQTFNGKLTALTSDVDQGDPDKVTGTLAFTVETKNSIT